MGALRIDKDRVFTAIFIDGSGAPHLFFDNKNTIEDSILEVLQLHQQRATTDPIIDHITSITSITLNITINWSAPEPAQHAFYLDGKPFADDDAKSSVKESIIRALQEQHLNIDNCDIFVSLMITSRQGVVTHNLSSPGYLTVPVSPSLKNGGLSAFYEDGGDEDGINEGNDVNASSPDDNNASDGDNTHIRSIEKAHISSSHVGHDHSKGPTVPDPVVIPPSTLKKGGKIICDKNGKSKNPENKFYREAIQKNQVMYLSIENRDHRTWFVGKVYELFKAKGFTFIKNGKEATEEEVKEKIRRALTEKNKGSKRKRTKETNQTPKSNKKIDSNPAIYIYPKKIGRAMTGELFSLQRCDFPATVDNNPTRWFHNKINQKSRCYSCANDNGQNEALVNEFFQETSWLGYNMVYLIEGEGNVALQVASDKEKKNAIRLSLEASQKKPSATGGDDGDGGDDGGDEDGGNDKDDNEPDSNNGNDKNFQGDDQSCYGDNNNNNSDRNSDPINDDFMNELDHLFNCKHGEKVIIFDDPSHPGTVFFNTFITNVSDLYGNAIAENPESIAQSLEQRYNEFNQKYALARNVLPKKEYNKSEKSPYTNIQDGINQLALDSPGIETRQGDELPSADYPPPTKSSTAPPSHPQRVTKKDSTQYTATDIVFDDPSHPGTIFFNNFVDTVTDLYADATVENQESIAQSLEQRYDEFKARNINRKKTISEDLTHTYIHRKQKKSNFTIASIMDVDYASSDEEYEYIYSDDDYGNIDDGNIDDGNIDDDDIDDNDDEDGDDLSHGSDDNSLEMETIRERPKGRASSSNSTYTSPTPPPGDVHDSDVDDRCSSPVTTTNPIPPLFPTASPATSVSNSVKVPAAVSASTICTDSTASTAALVASATLRNEKNRNDVLCSQGGTINSHSGNVQFQSLVVQQKDAYKQATNGLSKKTMSDTIVKFIRRFGNKNRDKPQAKKTFNHSYRVGTLLGEGAFSKVKEVEGKDGRLYAAKMVNKSGLTRKDDLALKDEISILCTLNHPNIIKLYDTFDEFDRYYLVTELMRGGELFDRIVTKTFYNEKEARDVCKILFGALQYCHEQNIAHRDLKPENLLLMSRSNDREIKLADFGFAKKVSSENCLLTQCGTPGYVAPEILHGVPYGTKADMWSIGVIAYILLGGYPPFIEQNQRELFKKIKRGQYEFHLEYWGGISPEAKDMISRLLTTDPQRRMSASDAIHTSWILKGDSQLAGIDLCNNLQQFRKYNAKRKLRQAVLTLVASTKITILGYQFRSNLWSS